VRCCLRRRQNERLCSQSSGRTSSAWRRRVVNHAATPFEWRPGRLRLGQQYEHTPLVVAPGSERILVVADDDEATAPPEREYPSVWHWVLWMERNERSLCESGADAT
jgi:hypothetical protein